MTNPQISVVMPVYNRKQYLKESIESILNQTFTHFEFIIVDDQSTDSSWQTIQEYTRKDSRIVAVKNTAEKGCWSARNFGWNLAKGKYIAVMDSDDIALPQRLQTQFDFMEQNPDIDICGSWIKMFGNKENITELPELNNEIRDLMFFVNSIAQPSIILKTAAFEKFNLKYKNYIAEDYELWSRAINLLKFYNIQEPLLLYRTHVEQIGTSKKIEQDNCADYIRLRNLRNIGIELSEEENQRYLNIVAGNVAQTNNHELTSAIKILDEVSRAGTKHGYGNKFQETIRNFIKNIAEHSLQNKVTSLRLYLTTFHKWRIFETPRTNLRYIYHCLRNILHV